MSTSTKVKQIFQKYDFLPTKRLGQNFLTNEKILKRIIQVANIKNKDVVEIGPGLGFLTNLLIKEANTIIAYEIDTKIISILKKEINASNFTLKTSDFLKQKFDWNDKKTVVANIPYYITSNIIWKLFDNIEKFDRAILMVQEEVANRLVAPVGSKTYGKFTVTANYFTNFQIKKEFVVLPHSFTPMPKVNSAIISLKFSSTTKDPQFVWFIKKCFTMRRKTLFNNLKQIWSIEKIHKIFNQLNLQNSIRPQELSLDQFIKLFKNIK